MKKIFSMSLILVSVLYWGQSFGIPTTKNNCNANGCSAWCSVWDDRCVSNLASACAENGFGRPTCEEPTLATLYGYQKCSCS